MINSNNSDQEDYHYRFKVVVLGDVKSGKTAFLDTLTQNNGKVIEIESSEEISERVSLHVNDHLLFKITYWEIPGKERHLKFINNYCLGAAVAIVLFDTTKNSTLEKAEKLLQSIDSCEIPFKILVGNKVT
jgi:signal recognition particle receptor subunit beta